MIYMRYKAEKEDWLAKHPHVHENEYWKKRGLPIWNRRILEDHRHHLPWERRKPSGELIRYSANWTFEEISAWLDDERRKEDQLADEMLEVMNSGRVIKDRDLWIAEETAREKELEKQFHL